MKITLPFISLPFMTLLLAIPIITQGQGVKVTTGTTLKFSGSPYFVMSGGDFTNHGTYTKAGETFKFSGAGIHEIKGSQSTDFNNLTIASGTTLQLPVGQFVRVSGTLTNNAGSGGLVIMSDATGRGSLIHNTTNIDGTVKCFIAQRPDNLLGWHFLSSPVAAQAIQTEFVPNPPSLGSQAFFSWDEPTALWINTKDGSGNWSGFEANFIKGKGYLVSYNDPGGVTKNFAGALNVSDVNRAGLTRTGGTYSGWNLVGNPFSSAISWYTGWTTTPNIGSVAKIWNGSGASYSDINPGDIIPSTQGFMVQVASGTTGSVTIPASARTHSSQPWYKSAGDPFIKLKANNLSCQTFQESVIIFNPESTLGYDKEFDAYFLAGYAPQFYSIEGGENLSTNVLPGMDIQTTIPLGFIKTEGSDYNIEAVKIENITQPVYLIDLKLNKTQNLRENAIYTFTSSAIDDPARFLLSFRPLGIEKNPGESSGIYAYNHTIFIDNPGASIVEIYNMVGQKMVTENTHNEQVYSLKLDAATGYYIVRLTSGQKVVSEKIFVK